MVNIADARATNWTKALITTPGGIVKPIFLNALISLREAPMWQGAFRYNSFSLIVELIKPPPWLREGQIENFKIRPWTDHDDALLTEWVQRRGLIVPPQICASAVHTVAKEQSYHPVHEYLSGLAWDGTPRLETWLCKYLSADDGEFNRAVGKRWLISGIARVMKPGPECKADCVLVLQGLQGIGKSSVLQVLAGQWFSDEIRRFGSKDAAMGLGGRWIVELSELSALGDVTLEQTKAFLSQTMDRYRPPYGRYVTDNARQCIFGATTNKESFLKDETGDRRWWPVRCGNLDIAGLRTVRDQLWAEALHCFNQGEVWWLDTPKLRRLAERVQGERFDEDPWEASVLRWLTKRNPEEVTIEGVLSGALGVLPEEANKSHRNRVSAILRFHKWERTNDRGKMQAKIWKKLVDTEKAAE